MPERTNGRVGYTVPGLYADKASQVRERLQQRLDALIDLQMTLKHIHWNVVGPTFIGVHEMLDPQVDGVRGFVDVIAERIAALGGSPKGLVGGIVARRTWDDYELGRATVAAHLGALDLVYDGVIADHRDAMEALDDLDLVTQDIVIGQLQALEQYQWFVRAHLESSSGELATEGSTTETEAARSAEARAGTATYKG
jgi:starvation-inducible DNA-binding protein